MLEVEIARERIWLHPERALWWPRASALVLADVHIGKELIFQRHGIPIPGTISAHQLERMSSLLEQTGARRLVILGDLVHGAFDPSARLGADLEAWRQRHDHVQMQLIVGNHDRAMLNDLLSRLFDLHREPIVTGPFRFAHEPEPAGDHFTLAGHLHPGYVLRDGPRSRARMRLPAFWFRETVGVMPAFGSFTGLARITRAPRDKVFVLGDGRVVAV